jgi:hypothetical protein
MTQNRTGIIIGFAVGAAIVIAAAFYFYPSTKTAAPVAVPAAATAAHPDTPAPDPHAGEANRPASPHSFPAEPATQATGTLLAGTISLDPSITQSPGSAVTVFIIARSGPGKGKAVLARRIDAQSFPLQFALTGAHSMMTGDKPEKVSLEARIDLDGDAMTREPGSPTARLTSVAIGNSQIALTLRPEA